MGAEVGSTANNYEVLAKLAVGGMAEIFLARGANTTGVERYVVLKRILRDKANDTRFVQMFLEEARLAAQLQHANIAQVYDIGKLGDSYFFTMEYVHGETVRSLLERCSSKRKDIPVPSVLSVIAGTAAGLQHAHERIGVDGKPLSIVHRDISPSNLMMSYEGIVKVVDFGVAKANASGAETRTGTVKGKAAYMSPEQARGEPLDRRSDLFSLGIVAWEMLTTRRLFTGSTDFEIMSAVVRFDVPRPSSVRSGIPPELDALVLRLLAKSPKDRFQSGDDVVEALEAVATNLGHQLSQKALGRYIREVFGTRAEPWVELVSAGDGLDSVSVTSEPIPPTIASGRSYGDMTVDGLHDVTVSDAAMASRSLSQTRRGPSPFSDDLDTPTVAVASLRDVPPDVLERVPVLPTRKMKAAIPVSGQVVTGSPAPDQTIFGVPPSPVAQPQHRPSQPPAVMAQPQHRPSQPPAVMAQPQAPSSPPVMIAQPQRPTLPQPPSVVFRMGVSAEPLVPKRSNVWLFAVLGLVVIGAALASFLLVR